MYSDTQSATKVAQRSEVPGVRQASASDGAALTTASACVEIARCLAKMRAIPAIRIASPCADKHKGATCQELFAIRTFMQI